MAAAPRWGLRWAASACAAIMIACAVAPSPAQAAAVDAPLELIVIPDTYIDEVLPLKAWREQQGLRVDIQTTTSIFAQMGGRDIAESIHLYVTSRKAADPRLEYLLLFGDDPVIPGRLLQLANRSASPSVPAELRSVVSDMYYGVTSRTFYNASDLGDEFPAGPPWWGISDDTWALAPDIHVGRVPAASELQAASYVSRLIAWEQAPPAGVWQQRAVLGMAVARPPNGGSWATERLTQDAGVTFASAEASLVGKGLLNISLRDYPEWPQPYAPFDDPLDDASLFSEWNLGASLVALAAVDGPVPGGPGGHYGGDGTTAVFPPIARPSSLDGLSNSDKLPIYLAAYGSSANFSLSNDADISRALFAPAGGAALAVGFTGATASGTAPGGTLGGWRLASLLLTEALERPAPIGDVLDRARARFVSEARSALGPAFDANNTTLRTAVAGLTLLGDPASLPWLGPTADLAIEGPAGITPNAPATITVRVTSSSAAVANATVAVIDDTGDLVGRAITDDSGAAQMSLLPAARANWTLVASAAGYRRASAVLAIDSPPSATIIGPSENSTVAGPLRIFGSAGDPDAGDPITAVEVSVQGGPWQPAAGTNAWSITLDSLGLENGPNTVSARASDGFVWGNPVTVAFVVTNPKPPTVVLPYPQLYVNEDTVGRFPLDLNTHLRPSGPGATLSATVQGADGVRASIVGGELVATPDRDFNGAVTFVLSVLDSYGGSLDLVVHLGVLPIADPPVLTVGGNSTVLEGGTVNFDPRAFDPDGTSPLVYLDLAPEGATTTGWQTPRQSAGNYTLVFAASDGLFITLVTVDVTVEPYNSPPSAALAGPTQGEAGRELQFSAESISDPDGDTLSFQWDFGDGQRAVGPSATHVYAAAGSYAVSLTVTDGRQSSTVTRAVEIEPYRPPGTPPPGFTAFLAYASISVIALSCALAAYQLWTARRPSPPQQTGELSDPPASQAPRKENEEE